MNIKAVQAQTEFGIKSTIRLAGMGAFTWHIMHRSRLVVGSLLCREQERWVPSCFLSSSLGVS